MTAASLILLAIADSINPSAIVVTLYLLSRSGAGARVGVYVAAIFLTYFTMGFVMVMGLNTFFPSLGTVLDSPPGLAGQGMVGGALLIWSLSASVDRDTAASEEPAAARHTYAALALLGVTVTVMELPTALPYAAAIAVLTAASLPFHERVWLLGVYNVIFVLPPLALLAGHLAAGRRLEARYAALRARLQRGAHETALWIAGLVGGALLVTSAIELVARLR